MHVDRCVKTAHELIQQCLLSARVIHVDVLYLFNHAVLLIYGVPYLLAIVGGVGLLVFDDVYVYGIAIVLFLCAPLAHAGGTIFLRACEGVSEHLRVGLRGILLPFLPEDGDLVVRALADCAFVGVAHALDGPEGTLVVHV